MMTPRQKAALERGSKIRTLCCIYALVKSIHRDLTGVEISAIQDACDNALDRIRGESETAKRKREALEWLAR